MAVSVLMKGFGETTNQKAVRSSRTGCINRLNKIREAASLSYLFFPNSFPVRESRDGRRRKFSARVIPPAALLRVRGWGDHGAAPCDVRAVGGLDEVHSYIHTRDGSFIYPRAVSSAQSVRRTAILTPYASRPAGAGTPRGQD